VQPHYFNKGWSATSLVQQGSATSLVQQGRECNLTISTREGVQPH